MKKLAILSVLALLILSVSVLPQANSLSTGKRQVTIVPAIDFNVESYETVYPWLSSLPKTNFTIVLMNWESLAGEQVTNLQSLGELIPGLVLGLQCYDVATREAWVNGTLETWETKFGSLPNGIFVFQPDTAILNFIKNAGLTYVLGYCFDQYVIDFMTERGGWQLPYYASESHVLRPNNETSGGVVVYPHVTWDWIDSFTLSHSYCNLVPEAYAMVNVDVVQYCYDLTVQTLDNAEPFGYATFWFSWHTDPTIRDYIEDIIDLVTSDETITTDNLSTFTSWFNRNYEKTPTYQLSFTSPHSGQTIEWYYSTDFRVARTNGTVVSYIDYDVQGSDIYLKSIASINSEGAWSSANDIDNSLTFTIDALGGAVNRAPINQTGFPYSGDLSSFPAEYAMRAPATIFRLVVALFFALFIACSFVIVVLRKRLVSRALD
jgi:hypothetical protein